jgi:hypothetical protein
MNLFEHFLQDFQPLFEARIRIQIRTQVKGRIRIRNTGRHKWLNVYMRTFGLQTGGWDIPDGLVPHCLLGWRIQLIRAGNNPKGGYYLLPFLIFSLFRVFLVLFFNLHTVSSRVSDPDPYLYPH